MPVDELCGVMDTAIQRLSASAASYARENARLRAELAAAKAELSLTRGHPASPALDDADRTARLEEAMRDAAAAAAAERASHARIERERAAQQDAKLPEPEPEPELEPEPEQLEPAKTNDEAAVEEEGKEDVLADGMHRSAFPRQRAVSVLTRHGFLSDSGSALTAGLLLTSTLVSVAYVGMRYRLFS